jgi:hypothetical protein
MEIANRIDISALLLILKVSCNRDFTLLFSFSKSSLIKGRRMEMRKHTAVSKQDFKVYEDYKSGEVISYFLSPEELRKYNNIREPVKAKTFKFNTHKKV